MNDFKNLLIDALTILGCDTSRFSAFDTHSTVALSFENIGDVLLEGIADDLWIWTDLGPGDVDGLGAVALEVLIELVKPTEYARGGQLMLATDNGHLMIKGIVLPSYLHDARQFATAIEGFFTRVLRMRELIK